MDIYSLPAIAVLSDFVSICQLDAIKVVRIQHPKAKAAISLFGGHVLSFQPNDEKEVLWLSENVDLSGKKPIRGGIPICWPWFGKVAEPSHGFVRNTQWALNQHRENDEGVIISLVTKNNEDTQAIWPHQFHLELQVEISNTLKVSLVTTNKGTENFNFGGALHSYFNIADINTTKVTNVGVHFIERKENHTGDGMATFNTEVDRIYTESEQVNHIEDTENKRIIRLSHIGNNSVVVWNPWVELATAMADMTTEGYLTMVCVETTNYDQSIVLEPEQSHTLACEIKISH